MATQRIAVTNVFRQGHRLILPSSTDSQSQDDSSQQKRLIINLTNPKMPTTFIRNPVLIKYPIMISEMLNKINIPEAFFQSSQSLSSSFLYNVMDSIKRKNDTKKSVPAISYKNTSTMTCENLSSSDASSQTSSTTFNLFNNIINNDFNVGDVISKYCNEDNENNSINDKAVMLFKDKKYYEAVQIFYSASRRGDYGAAFNLAQCLYEGKGIPENKVKAVQIWEELSKKNHKDSLYQLAVCLINGIGISKDRNRGIQLMEKASNLKHPEATYFMTIKNMKSPDVDEELLKSQISLLISISPKYENRFRKFLGYKDFPERISVIVKQILINIDKEYNRCFQSLFFKFPF
uniref:HCP-like protein n=1 Tax=Parastrongyloides trichosuri TaxID=131310 RepID=A0A0N4Z754_PARTI